MTSTETIRSTLARLWDTGANAYEMAMAVMQAADIESAELELEVESVVARALLAREFVDLSKLAAEVAKVLPGEGVVAEAVPTVPLSEAILMEMEGRKTRSTEHIIEQMQTIIRKHFAALSVEEVARVLCGWRNGARSDTPFYGMSEAEKAAYRDQAQAIMKLLRKE